jgi:hypothetical protein
MAARRQPDVIAEAFERAVALLHAQEGNILALPEVAQTVLFVHAARGLIENGGLEYFFEDDFPGQPAYDRFAAAFRTIGAAEAADRLHASMIAFGLDEPHRHCALRRTWLAQLPADPSHPFRRWSDQSCGDDTVWKKLDSYIELHRDALGL